MIKKIFYTTISLFIVLVSFVTKTEAADYSLSINPPLLRVHIKPGKSITQTFTINNQSTTTQTLVASIVPFSSADNYGNPLLNPKSNAPWLSYFTLANANIKFDEPFSISADSSEQLILSLSIPDSAPLQDIYATLLVATYDNTLGKTLQGTTLRATIGSNLLITTSSKANPDTILIISDLLPTEGTFIKIGNLYFVDSLTPLKFSAEVSNEGNFASETRGVFKVITGNNKPVFLEGILPVNVIAKSKRVLVNTNANQFEFAPSIGQIGLHQISMEIKTDNASATSSLNIFFFPLKLSLGLLTVLIIIITIIKFSPKTKD